MEPADGEAAVGSFLCSDCGINFETPQDVLIHRRIAHPSTGTARSLDKTEAGVAGGSSSNVNSGPSKSLPNPSTYVSGNSDPNQTLPSIAGRITVSASLMKEDIRVIQFTSAVEGTSLLSSINKESITTQGSMKQSSVESKSSTPPSDESSQSSNEKLQDSSVETSANQGKNRPYSEQPDESIEYEEAIRSRAEAALRELNSRKGRYSGGSVGSKWGLKFPVTSSPSKEKPSLDSDSPEKKTQHGSGRFSLPLVRKVPLGTRFASLGEKKKKPVSELKSDLEEAGCSGNQGDLETSGVDVYEFEDDDAESVPDYSFRATQSNLDKSREEKDTSDDSLLAYALNGLEESKELTEENSSSESVTEKAVEEDDQDSSQCDSELKSTSGQNLLKTKSKSGGVSDVVTEKRQHASSSNIELNIFSVSKSVGGNPGKAPKLHLKRKGSREEVEDSDDCNTAESDADQESKPRLESRESSLDVVDSGSQQSDSADDLSDSTSAERGSGGSSGVVKVASRRRRAKSDLLISIFAKSRHNFVKSGIISRSKSFVSVLPPNGDTNSDDSDGNCISDESTMSPEIL